MDFNAYVTTDANHRLTADSKVFVLDPVAGMINARVPERHLVGGVLWAHRVNDALLSIGWMLASVDGVRDVAEGLQGESTPVYRFHAVPKES